MPNQFHDQLICGDALNVMRDLIPDGIFQTCITSPPYWGLRDYGLEPVVWGGNDCDHVWETHHQPAKGGRNLPDNLPTVGSNIYLQTTSLRNDGIDSAFCSNCGAWLGCLGLEPTPELYVKHLVQIFREVKRVIKDDGTLWLNIGDSYAGGNRGGNPDDSPFRKQATNNGSLVPPTPIPPGSTLKPKDMVLIPFRLALALQAEGWWVRSDIIWKKPNVMPSSVKDRPTVDFEHVFLLAKSKKYYYDQDAIREPYTAPMDRWGGDKLEANGESTWDCGTGQMTYRHRDMRPNKSGRNKRTVWTVNTKPYSGAHFATFPPELIEPMILAGTKEDDIVFDPFAGSGTTLAEARSHCRHYFGIEPNREYIDLIEKRIAETPKKQLELDLGGGK